MSNPTDEEPLLQSDDDDTSHAGGFMPRAGSLDTWVIYSTKNEAIVKTLMKELRKLGVQCWDHKNIIAGEDSLEAIGQALKRARQVLIIYSQDFADSSYCTLEKSMAYTLKLKEKESLKIFAVRLDDVTLPPEVEALQYVHGIDRRPTDIAIDLASAFTTGVIPADGNERINQNQIKAIDGHPMGVDLTFVLTCTKRIEGETVYSHLRASPLGSTVTSGDLEPVFDILNQVPWIEESFHFSFCWLFTLILLCSIFGVTVGFAFGGAHTLIAHDAWHYYLHYSWPYITVASGISIILVLVQFSIERRKEINFLHFTLRRINAKLNRKFKLLLHLNDCVTNLVFYKFDFKNCQEELQGSFSPLVTDRRDLVIEERTSSAESEDDTDYDDEILWNYLVAFRQFRSKNPQLIEYPGPSKHVVCGWKCLCQFVQDNSS